MCSVDPDEIVEMTRAADGLDISSGDVMCRKCGTEKAMVVLRIKDAYCRECFLSYFIHKFRSTIGKSKLIRPGDRILIATSGGISSSTLLHLVRDGLNETSHKKLRFEPVFLYIDESCLSDNPDAGSEFINEICSNVTSLGFPCYVATLEQVMSSESSLPLLFTKDGQAKPDTNSDLRDQMKELLSSCKSESAKQDLLLQLRREALYQCADALGYHKIFLADNATTLSICILANVAVGRGSQLSDRVQFKAQHKNIEVYRPMREILQTEIQYYINLHNISTVQAPSLKLKGPSITSCTEDFIMGLQKEFPATIPTIFRTGDKLVSSSMDGSKCSTPDLNGYADNDDANTSINTICAMCGSQLDTTQSEASAVNASLVSQKLSCIGVAMEAGQKVLPDESPKVNESSNKMPVVPSNASSIKSCEELDAKNKVSNDCCTATNYCECSQQSKCCNSDRSSCKEDHVTNKLIPKKTMERYLCYGCRIILRELAEVNHLPIKLRGSVAEQERRKHMREQIQDFLL